MGDVNGRGRLGEGSMGARNIRCLQYIGTNPSRLTYGAKDEAKLEELIVIEVTTTRTSA